MEDIQKKFTEAYEENADALFRYCFFRVNNRETAKDMLQETFMKTWEYIVKGHSIENLRAFFYKTIHNIIIDYYRKHKALSLEALTEQGFDVPEDNRENVQNKLDGERAIALIRRIPDPYREAVFMRYVQELELEEIAKITGETANTISVRIHRGLEKIRKFYKHGPNI